MTIYEQVLAGTAQRAAHNSVTTPALTRSNMGSAYMRDVAAPRRLLPRMTITRASGTRVVEIADEMHHS